MKTPLAIVAWSSVGAFVGLVLSHLILVTGLTCAYLASSSFHLSESFFAIAHCAPLLIPFCFLGGFAGFFLLGLRGTLPGTR